MISYEEIERLGKRPTPFYLYDMALLYRTLNEVKESASINSKFRVHYAMKACCESEILSAVRSAGFGLDTVSGGEIELGLKAGFKAKNILFAGVGKTDREIDLALKAGIGAFNVESLPELEVISERSESQGLKANVVLRINPNIDAHTHQYITTGLSENKFGISLGKLDKAVDLAMRLPGVEFQGLHFHIGSQITVLEPFEILCERTNKIVEGLNARGIGVHSIDMGGGLGIDYEKAMEHPIPDFKSYFNIFNQYLNTEVVEEVHFELGRSIVGQCGNLVTKVVYVKDGDTRTYAIVDAGMSELIRPALYGMRHTIENVSGKLRNDPLRTVDVVGPVCESSDVFGKDYELPSPSRGDVLIIRSAGAYGSSMASHYNARSLEPSIYYFEKLTNA